MAFIDYYKILGLTRTYLRRMFVRPIWNITKQFHPDLHPDDPKAKAKFQALNEAFDVINDPEKRKKYDQYGEQWRNAEAYEQAAGHGQSIINGVPAMEVLRSTASTLIVSGFGKRVL